MSADENYQRRVRRGQDDTTAALLAIADGVDELIALLRPLVAEAEPTQGRPSSTSST